MENVVTASWLADNLHREDLVVLDCSVAATKDPDGRVHYASGLGLFETAHIPGAQHADLVETLSAASPKMIFALPDPELVRTKLGKLGVGDNTTVVLYDRSFTAWAARVWWMLRWIGFDTALILDGGLPAWIDAGLHVSVESKAPTPRTLSMRLRKNVMADQSDVQMAVRESGTCLLDTLHVDSFTGAANDYARPGHIPGATHAFTLDLFNEDGTFKPRDMLAALCKTDPSARQITYCGAGILAAASAFVLVQLGYKDVALYAASLQEWAANDSNPMEL